MIKRIGNFLLFAVMIVLVIWLFFKIKNLPSISNLFKPKNIEIQNTPVVVKQIQALAQLVTVSMYEELVVDSNATDKKIINLPLLPDITLRNDAKTLVVVGKITTHVGVDMQKLSTGDISGTTDSIHILLPAAEVLDAIINPSGVTVFIEQGEWNNQVVINLKNKIRYIAIADAQSRGLLSQSEVKARQIITGFFTAAGYKKVVVQFKGNRSIKG